MRTFFLFLLFTLCTLPAFANEGTGTDSFCPRHGCGVPTTVVEPCTSQECETLCDPIQVCAPHFACDYSTVIASCQRAEYACKAQVSLADIRALLYRFHLQGPCVTRSTPKGTVFKCRKRIWLLIDP